MKPALLLILGTAVASVSCSNGHQKPNFEYMPDMAHTAAYKSFSPNPVTHDGLTLQRPVKGTIAREFQPFHYGATPEEAERAGRELKSPLQPTAQVLADGRVLYGTFCQVCHGPRGKGDGPIVGKIPNPPSYTSPRVASMQPGQLFHVVTMGSGKMPSYATQITAEERWKIVAYVQTLQSGTEIKQGE